MWSYVVVVDLVARNDRRLRLLEATHDLLSVTDFTVQAFHLVVVLVALNPDAVNMLIPFSVIFLTVSGVFCQGFLNKQCIILLSTSLCLDHQE